MSDTSAARGSRAGGAGRAPKRPLKSPLAVHGEFRVPAAIGAADIGVRAVQGALLTDRAATLAEFEDHLRTTSSRDGRPYEEATVNAYVSPGKTLDAWLAAEGIDRDFTACDAATLNRFFREYYLEHGQGGRTHSSGTSSRCSASSSGSAGTRAHTRTGSAGTPK
jgi:hypothetical protein